MRVARSILASSLALKCETEIKIRGLRLTSFRTVLLDCKMPGYTHTTRRNKGGGFYDPVMNAQLQICFPSYFKSVRIVTKSAY